MPWFLHRSRELQHMLHTRRKAEIQILCSLGNDRLVEYLRSKVSSYTDDVRVPRDATLGSIRDIEDDGDDDEDEIAFLD